ncbi:DUF2752 domain-containing protein [Flavobacterium sp. NKUCC04_CG]|uniref:DUF2752 domain-containing protein n=1 Tax=Flavobacterium sp. NKUCC04_CG TaxID=2842121 RepID=UPI001C5B5D11|nr:DUF2752 domain-containing protein [Flavobacterium sp. NKUCC04_CG]
MPLNSSSIQSYRIINYTLLVLFMAGLLWLLFSPVTPSCYYQKNYGINCPTCGLTRDFKSILKGDFSGLIAANSFYYFSAFSLVFLSRIVANTLLYYRSNRNVLMVYETVVAVCILILLILGLSQTTSI